MAKMFYNLSEVADKLGINQDAVQKLVDQGKLQQFRDRDKVMFKRDQVDELMAMNKTMDLGGAVEEDDDASLSLDDTVDGLSTDTQSLTLDAGDTDVGKSVDFDVEVVDGGDDKAETDEMLVVDGEGDETGALELDQETGPIDIEDDAAAIGTSDETGELESPEEALSLTDETGELEIDLEGPSGDSTGVPVSVDEGDDEDQPLATAPINVEEDVAAESTGIAMEEIDVDTEDDVMTFSDSGMLSDTPSPAEETGVSVFDSQEISPVDTHAQTILTKKFEDEEEELSLESVGSGSGLLDLTRESDDSSLGAVELLDDVDPAGDSGAGTMEGTINGSVAGTGAAATGIFEGAEDSVAEAEAEADDSAAEFEELEGGTDAGMAPALAAAGAYGGGEEADVFGGLSMLTAFAILVVTGLIAFTATKGQVIELVDMVREQFWAVVGGAGGLGLVMFIVDIVVMKKSK